MIQIRNWRFYVLNFISPPPLMPRFLFCFRLLVSFPCAYFRITPFVLVYFVHQLLERCFFYQFFFLRCCVSSFPSRAPFLYPLFSFRSVLFLTLSLHILTSLLSAIRCRSLTNSARAVQDTSMNYVARPELTSAVLKARSHTAY